MHYIVGTKIAVSNVRRATGTRSIGTPEIGRPVNSEYFEPGKEYSLYYIRKVDEGINYTFNDEQTGDKTVVTFESALKADQYIAKILGEKLPNYDKFYKASNQ
jgi:hypothetical protein